VSADGAQIVKSSIYVPPVRFVRDLIRLFQGSNRYTSVIAVKIGYVAGGTVRQTPSVGNSGILWLPSDPDELLEGKVWPLISVEECAKSFGSWLLPRFIEAKLRTTIAAVNR
jgi:hypothetical protein